MLRPIIYAHRGASAYAPENTLAAFQKAMEQQAGGIELDVHLSKDGCPVVVHDERVDRTSNGSGWVKDMDLESLKKLDFGSWFSGQFSEERIPTLEEVLLLLENWEGILNIELKSGPVIYEGLESKVSALLERYGRTENAIISSFNHYSLLNIKGINPSLKIGLLYMAGLVAPWEYAKRVGAEAIHPLFYNIQPPIVEGCKRHGVMMNPFTVDDPQYIKALALAGVDGIITNVPDIALDTIRQLE